MGQVLGIAGRIGAGKSHAARALAARGWRIVKFASPLKSALGAIYRLAGLTPEAIDARLEGALKEAPDPAMAGAFARGKLAGWSFAAAAAAGFPDAARRDLDLWASASWRDHDWTPRRLMQELGTEWGRRRMGDDFWVDRWREKAAEALAENVAGVVADDVRFENEAAAVRDLGGRVILVQAAAAAAPAASHASENLDLRPDLIVPNRFDEAYLHSIAWVADQPAAPRALAR